MKGVKVHQGLAGLDPLSTPEVTRFGLRLPLPVFQELEALAKAQGTSINRMIVHALIQWLDTKYPPRKQP
jgi:predicted HicB family RNase H-like nuclease